jgi:hypothetical protein
MITFEEKELVSVYVAGAITPTNRLKHPQVEFLENIQRGISICLDLISRGYAPLCTFFDFLYFLIPKESRLTIETIHKVSTALMCRCEILFVSPGSEKSSGTKKEIKKAKELGKPICRTYKALDECRKKILSERRLLESHRRKNGNT